MRSASIISFSSTAINSDFAEGFFQFKAIFFFLKHSDTGGTYRIKFHIPATKKKEILFYPNYFTQIFEYINLNFIQFRVKMDDSVNLENLEDNEINNTFIIIIVIRKVLTN